MSARGRTSLAMPLAVPLVLALGLAACTGAPGNPGASSSPTTSSTGPVDLTVSVYGAPGEVAAYRRVVNSWNDAHPRQQLTLTSADDRDAQREALTTATTLPDIFLVSRRELGWLMEHQATQPVGELLDERGISFGDDLQRSAIEAFSAADDLQCMPWGVSPMVIYYNTDLIDFDEMRAAGLDAPEDHTGWTFEQFAAAAEQATGPGIRGLQIDQTLRGLAPFIYSAGGRIFDNETQPTALAFSSGDTISALEKTLPLLRNPLVTMIEEQLARDTPLEWFEKGRLGMMEGFRSLTPELRTVLGLNFDVMPMPTISGRSTIGDISGFCISATAADAGVAADVIAFFAEPQNVADVTRAGYLVPANVEAAESDAFLQPELDPMHASVFNETVRDIIDPPLLDDPEELEAAIEPEFSQLFAIGVLDLPTVTAAIDAAGLSVLPRLLPSPTP